MKALLDTNFLMVPGEYKVDVISELMNLGYIEFYTLDLVVNELEKLSVKTGKACKAAKAARIALVIIRNSGVIVLRTKGDLKRVDDEIFRLAKTGEYTVCTQDRELMMRTLSAKLRCVSLRQNKYLSEFGGDF